MRTTMTQLYIHFVWATWDRLPLINEALRAKIMPAILNESTDLGAEVLAIGGVEDHVHLLVRMPTTIAICHYIRKVKVASSIVCGPAFRWQGSYGAFSVTRSHVGRVIDYVQRQEEHHRLGTTHKSLEPEARCSQGGS